MNRNGVGMYGCMYEYVCVYVIYYVWVVLTKSGVHNNCRVKGSSV